MEKGKKNIWIYASFSLLFSFSSFLSFFHFINQSGILFILKKKNEEPFFQRASKCLTRLSERARFSRVPWFGKHSTSFSIIDSSVFIPMSACIFVHPPVLISVFPVNHRMQIRASRGYYRFSRRGAKKDFSSIDAPDILFQPPFKIVSIVRCPRIQRYTFFSFPLVENIKFDEANWKSAKSVV